MDKTPFSDPRLWLDAFLAIVAVAARLLPAPRRNYKIEIVLREGRKGAGRAAQAPTSAQDKPNASPPQH